MYTHTEGEGESYINVVQFSARILFTMSFELSRAHIQYESDSLESQTIRHDSWLLLACNRLTITYT